jgi:hypothetical protein
MGREGREDDDSPTGRFADDLIGLDPHDPEVQAFAAHLDRMERPNSKATVEGMLEGVEDFAQSANRARGHRHAMAVLVVALILAGVVFALWNSLVFVLETFFG